MRITDAYKQPQSFVADPDVRATVLNLPNLVTATRMLLIPVFVVLFSHPTPPRAIAAATVFAVAAITDWLDGYLARRRSQITKLGRLLDPIADKLLVLSGLILLVEFHQVGALLAILIIAREVVVTGIRAIAATEGIVMSAETTGKYKMVAQVVAIVLLILEHSPLLAVWNVHLAGTILLYVALGLGLWSGGQYLGKFWRQVALKGPA
jgi:CDP-diacylglycerol---glycerol-3-phosphate 3-phosphatidyltransferase